MAKRGLYANIHAKKKRIAAGSGEKMRKPGAKGAPTAANFKRAAKTAKKKPKKKKAGLNKDICLGCGLCVRACQEDSLKLKSLPQRVITPLNGAHRAVVMAIERGKLQHLIFDNRVLFSHRALAALLGVILQLPPVKQILAMKQVKSRYLETLISYMEGSDSI